MKYDIIMLLVINIILNLSLRYKININYIYNLTPITITELSCSAEDNINALAALVKSEAANQDSLGQVMIVRNVLDRVNSNIFPNTIDSVIYQYRQYDGIKTKYFTVEDKYYQLVKNYQYVASDTSYLYYYNPKIATNKKFIKWCNKYYKSVNIQDHIFHYAVNIKV